MCFHKALIIEQPIGHHPLPPELYAKYLVAALARANSTKAA
jgi:hypothetical protein